MAELHEVDGWSRGGRAEGGGDGYTKGQRSGGCLSESRRETEVRQLVVDASVSVFGRLTELRVATVRAALIGR